MGLVFHFFRRLLRTLALDLIPRKVRRLVGGLFMGIGGIMFLLGLAMDPPLGFIVAGIGFLVGMCGFIVWDHVNIILE
jgi:hypothetical protein